MKTDKLQKVVDNMKAAGLKQLLITSPSNIAYLTGRMIHQGERLVALYIEDSGNVVFIANRLFAQQPLDGAELVQYDDTDDTAVLLSRFVKDGVLGVDKDMKCRFALPLTDLRSNIKLTIGSPCIDRARMVKTSEEIELMRKASLLNDKVTEKTISAIRPGMSENEVADLYRAFAAEEGTSESFESLICFGENCAEPHHSTDGTVIKTGDSVIIDVGVLFGGYCADMTRTVFLGSVTNEQQQVYELVQAANAAGKAAVKPGVPLSEVDAAARNVIENAGYGKYFIHRTGHNIGSEVHEYPDVSMTSKEVCTPGMVFSVEPGIYLPGKFGVRIEDLVLVTENGCECLNKLPRDLKVI